MALLRRVVGKWSQYHLRYGNTNDQCTSNALSSLCFSKILAIGKWTPSTITEILDLGFEIHKKSFNNRTDKSSTYLTADELIKDIVVGGYRMKSNPVLSDFIELQGSVYYDFVKVLGFFFNKYNYGIFTSKDKSLGLFKNGETYCLFDPHGCDKDTGTYVSGGVALAMEFSDISGLISLLKKNFVVDADINKTYLNGFTITPFEFLLHDIPKSVDLSELPVCEHSVDDNVLVNEVVMNNAVQCSMLASGIDNMMMMTNQPTPMTNLNEISQDCDREFTVVINKKKTRKIKMSAEKRKKKAKECMKNLRSQVEFKEKEKTVETDNNEKNSKKMELNKLFKEQGKKNNLQNQKIKAKEQNNKKNLQELERQKNRQIEYDIPVNVDSPELHVCEHSVINNVSTTVSEVVMNAEFPVCENNVVDNVSTTVTEIVVNDAVQCSMLSSGNDDMMMVDQPTLLSDFTDIEKECNGEFTVVNELQGGKKTKKPMSRKQRNEIRKQNIRKKREDIEYTLKANEKNKFQMKRKRGNPDYVVQANEKNKFKMQKTRENKEYTEKEYAINSKRKQKYRLCPTYRNKENIKSSNRKQKYRLCPLYKNKESILNSKQKQKYRLCPAYKMVRQN
uniref:Peptidase C76 domain-containing protein n=1 Tax=Cacopsylla melanoneura TaxID=428564 RepID=A0A8D8S051_9HEMI